MKYRLVAFDFDGTVADSFGVFVEALNATANTHGFRAVTPAMIDELRGLNSREIRRFLKIPFWQVPRIAATMRQRMQARIHEVRLFPGIDAVLARLATTDIELGIVTSNSFENVRRVLGAEQQALIRHFVCDVRMFGKHRPLRQLLKRSGIPADAALYIGDETRDAQAARAAGWDFNGVSWGYATPAVLQPHSANPLFRQVEDIFTAICPAHNSRLKDGANQQENGARRLYP